ncbi:App1 family protein [Granulosicoccaceae sp. 1_MG-2023]|nr:App1 family protein [Granulosicoccaceae sp. 1_MG-2023]
MAEKRLASASRRSRLARRLFGLAAALMALSPFAKANSDDEVVLLYPAYGVKRGDVWEVALRVGVSEEPGTARRAVSSVARRLLARRAGLSTLSEEEKTRFAGRARGFVADNESGERVSVRFDEDPASRRWPLSSAQGDGGTGLNGYAESLLRVPETFIDSLPAGGAQPWYSLSAVSPEHRGGGQIQLVSETGLSVISDIDDTLKITGLTEGEQTILRRTFFEPFRAVPCMAAFYRSFPEGTVFHYVSGTPWQLYPPVADFLFTEAGFPRGSVHMKTVRTHPFSPSTYRDLAALVLGEARDVTFAQKLAQIRSIVADFPRREFILVGDSGEMDPEIFSRIREAFPRQVRAIYIRDVNGVAQREPARLAGMQVIVAGAEHKAGLPGRCP